VHVVLLEKFDHSVDVGLVSLVHYGGKDRRPPPGKENVVRRVGCADVIPLPDGSDGVCDVEGLGFRV